MIVMSGSTNARATDVEVVAASLYFLPVETRVPYKFGTEIMTGVSCTRVHLEVVDARSQRAAGWGETPLSVQWVWPGALPYAFRHDALKQFCRRLVTAWASFTERGHALEIGYRFQRDVLPRLLTDFNAGRGPDEAMPWLAALVCCSAFDLALHDAYGNVLNRPTYSTYNAAFMSTDLSHYLMPADDASVSFIGLYPTDFIIMPRPDRVVAWHSVGASDALDESDLTGAEPQDGYPVTLKDWIARDGLLCLKVKLCGTDADWDYERLTRVGRLAIEGDVLWLCADFNCTASEPDYVNAILDRLLREQPRVYGMILYVEQPFPYDLEAHPINVRSVAARKPLFMDESAHDWRLVRRGRELGWTGVALKTCKTQSAALLMACWARAHGMTLMVQDLTNPMLAQISHVLLAAHSGTVMGLESNAMQFYPAASAAEARVHPDLYRRRGGALDLSTLGTTGFGYRLDEIERELPAPTAVYER